MKFTPFTTPLVAFMALVPTTFAASCGRSGFDPISWVVVAGGVPDISGICGGLWDNLHRFSECSVSHPYCGPDVNGALKWEFTVPAICNAGMVESTWWEATANNWGSIDC